MSELTSLTPQEDHHLKNQLIYFQIQSEFNQLWLDHTSFLRNLGYPFSAPENIESVRKNPIDFLLDSKNDQYPLLKFVFVNFIKTFPYMVGIDEKITIKFTNNKDFEISKKYMKSIDHTNNNDFLFYKFLPFFNYVLGKNLSDSIDRQELTKRKKMGLKINRLLTLFFSSSLSTFKEIEYYDPKNNLPTGKNLDEKVTKEVEKLVKDLEQSDFNDNDESSNILLEITKKDIVNQIETKEYFNGYNVGIIGVHTCLPEESLSPTTTSFFGNLLRPNIKNTTYEFIISIQFKINIDEKPTKDNIQEFLVLRSFEEFKKLQAKLKRSLPDTELPKLPRKFKHSTIVKSVFGNSDEDYDINNNDDAYSENSNEDLINLQGINNIDDLFFEDKEIELQENCDEILKYVLKKNTGVSYESPNKFGISKIIGSPSNDNNDNSKSSPTSSPLFKSPTKFNSSTFKTPNFKKKHTSPEVDECSDDEDSVDNLEIKPKFTALPREKLRILLNNYLKSLIMNPTISKSIHLKEFFFQNAKSINTLNEKDKIDIKLRKHVEYLTIKNQLIFQKKIFLINKKLKNELITFKNLVLNNDNPNYLKKNFSPEVLNQYKLYINPSTSVLKLIMNEFKVSSTIGNFSPILKTFIKWLKLKLSSFIYDLFFTTNELDGSKYKKPSDAVTYELFNQIKRLHGMFPYTILQQILRVTNPLAMVKRLLDFFLYQPPSLGIPSFLGGGGNTEEQGNNDENYRTAHRSLLQILFNNVINSDIDNLNEKIKELEVSLTRKDPGIDLIITKLKKYFELNEISDKKKELIRDFKFNNTDLLLMILFKNNDENSTFQELKEKVLNSYSFSINDNKDERSSLYENLNELFKLLVRKHDKVIMNELWNESYLNNFIKDFLAVFFEPLIRIFARNSSFGKIVKMLQNFNNDLIHLVEYLFDYIYLLSPNEIILSIYLVFTKYQDFFINFLHESYLNDTEGFFDNVIDWISKLLKLSNYFKENDPNKKLNMDSLILKNEKNLNLDKLHEELNLIIKKRTTSVLKASMKSDISNKQKIDKEDFIKENWDRIENMPLFTNEDFNFFNDDDLEEFHEALEDVEAITDEDVEEEEEQTNRIMKSEIEKLSVDFKAELIKTLKHYQLENPI